MTDPTEPADLDAASDQEATPLTREELFTEADRLWNQFEIRNLGWHSYVPADWDAVDTRVQALAKQSTHSRRRPRFLEYGSGLGVVAILAARAGFDAWGIETDAWLHAQSIQLAKRAGVDARFALGSFLTDEDLEQDDEGAPTNTQFHTLRSGPDAFAGMPHELDDFDVVYCFPFPDDLEFLDRHLNRNGDPAGTYLSYHATDGVRERRIGDLTNG